MVEEERYRINILTSIDHVNHLPPRHDAIAYRPRGHASRQRRPRHNPPLHAVVARPAPVDEGSRGNAESSTKR
jgi:hypothetical protein